jgi:hypothetical protein
MCSPDGSTTKDTPAPVPFVAKVWLTIYEGIPAVHVPFTNFNISFTLLSAVFLTGCRFLSEYMLVNYFGWPDDGTPSKEGAASCAGICHSTILCTGLIVAFSTEKYDVAAKIETFTKTTGWWNKFVDALLQFCTAYMLYDGMINVLWLRYNPTLVKFEFSNDDVLFLAHHIVTSFYMISARVLGAGHQSAMICMLLGELTNPLSNLYLIGELAMKLDCCNGPTAQQLRYIIKITFAIMYNLFRVIIAPPFFAHTTYSLLLTKKGRTNVPLPLNIFWNVLIWGVCFGSASWIIMCNQIIVDYMSELGLTTTIMTMMGQEL